MDQPLPSECDHVWSDGTDWGWDGNDPEADEYEYAVIECVRCGERMSTDVINAQLDKLRTRIKELEDNGGISRTACA